MADEREEREEDEDKSIVDALSTLGWVEEIDEEEDLLESDENVVEQLNFFKEDNTRLIREMNEKLELISKLEITVKDLSDKVGDKSDDDQATQKLYETIESKNDEIEILNAQFEEETNKSKRIINDQVQRIKELSLKVEESQLDQTDLVSQKDVQIKELNEQLKYLEGDTIQKSKFQKLEVLLEKKDEIITEKEKTIFGLENSLKTANQRTQDIQQQLETFSLVKKDLDKKTERNKELTIQNDQLKQKNNTNTELLNRLERNLEEAHKSSGILTGKFELELGSLRNLIDSKDESIKEIKEKYKNIKIEFEKDKKAEEKFLNEIQNIKDEKLKIETEHEDKIKEVVELKKRIKLMRRDMRKT